MPPKRDGLRRRTCCGSYLAARSGRRSGGCPPLGYDLCPQGGKLVVNELEAEQVRSIYRKFADTRSFEATLEWLNERGWRRKGWTTAAGQQQGGSAFQQVSLQRLLQSEVYVGMVRYEDQFYHGEHGAIVDRRLWKRVNDELRNVLPERARRTRNKHAALLQGVLRCGCCGKPMYCSSTHQHGRRYRYYVCSAGGACRNRVPAQAIEQTVVEQLISAVPKNQDVRRLVKMYEQASPTRDALELLQHVLEYASYKAESREVVVRLKPVEARFANSGR